MNSKNRILYLILAFFTTFLFIERLMYLSMGFFAVILLITVIRVPKEFSNTSKYYSALILIVCATILCFLIYRTTNLSVLFSSKAALKEIARAVIYFTIITIISRMAVDIRWYSFVWRIILFAIVGVAFIQYTKIIDINSYLINFYGDSIQFYNTQFSSLSKFRCGSVFINPNVLAGFLVSYLALYIFILQHKKESNLLKVATFGAIAVGIVLSGSRTGMVLTVATVLVSQYLRSNMKIMRFSIRMAGILLICATAYLIFRKVSNIDVSEFRLLKMSEGKENSLDGKLSIFLFYLRSMNGINYLLGYGPFPISKYTIIDFDLGYMLMYYGFVGAFIYASIIKAIYNWSDTGIYGRNYMNTVFTVIFILFGLTAGMYYNFRIFSMYFVMFLPVIKKGGERIA